MAWITDSLEPRDLALKNPPLGERNGHAVPPELVLRGPVPELIFLHFRPMCISYYFFQHLPFFSETLGLRGKSGTCGQPYI